MRLQTGSNILCDKTGKCAFLHIYNSLFWLFKNSILPKTTVLLRWLQCGGLLLADYRLVVMYQHCMFSSWIHEFISRWLSLFKVIINSHAINLVGFVNWLVGGVCGWRTGLGNLSAQIALNKHFVFLGWPTTFTKLTLFLANTNFKKSFESQKWLILYSGPGLPQHCTTWIDVSCVLDLMKNLQNLLFLTVEK